jgi:hypothetical protein
MKAEPVCRALHWMLMCLKLTQRTLRPSCQSWRAGQYEATIPSLVPKTHGRFQETYRGRVIGDQLIATGQADRRTHQSIYPRTPTTSHGKLDVAGHSVDPHVGVLIRTWMHCVATEQCRSSRTERCSTRIQHEIRVVGRTV